MPDRTPRQPERPGLLSRAAAALMGALERKAQPALAYRHSGRGGSGYGSGAWWGDGNTSIVVGGLPDDGRDIAADAGDVWLNSAVSACLSWLTDQFSEPFLEVLSLDPKTGDYTPHPTHELIDLLENPNDGYDSDALWAATVLSWQVSGVAYWIKARAKSGKVGALWFAPWWEIEPVWPDDGSAFVSGFNHIVDGISYPLQREDVVQFRRGMDPADLRRGMAPLGAVIREVATDNSAAAYENDILVNQGIVPVLIQPAEPGDEFAPGEAEILKQQIQGGTTGRNRGRAVVVNARVDLKQYGLGPKDMTLGSIRYIPEDRICAATGVNAMVVGLSSGSVHKTYNNLGEATRAAYNRGLIPMQRGFARALTRQLLHVDFKGRPGLDYCEWNYDEVAALSEDADARATRAALLFEKRVIKRGEACEIAGCNPPADEFDVYLESQAVAQAVANADARDDGRINQSVTGKPGAPPTGDEPAVGEDAAADDDPPISRLRIAKALAKVDAARNGHASAHGLALEREDGTDPFRRIAAQVLSLAAPAGRPTETKAADDEPEPDPEPDPWADDDDDSAPDEANTYNLPTGKPIAARLREFFDEQLREVLGTVRELGADLGDPAAWAAGAIPAIPLGLDTYDRPMAQAMTPLIGAYWDESGRRTMARLGLDPDDWRVVDPHTRAMIEGAALAFSRSTNETTAKDLRGALDALRAELAAGIVDVGESLPQLTKRVQSVFENASKNRAKTIAETEASRAVHQAQLESARQSTVVWGKKLLLSSDACAICQGVLASMPEYGWPLDDPMYDDGKGHPDYSVATMPPIHVRCRCACVLVTWEEAPPDVVRPDYGSVFDVGDEIN